MTWAGVGKPFRTRTEADSTMAGYETIRMHVRGELPPGAAKLVILRRKPAWSTRVARPADWLKAPPPRPKP